jgi:hypothetical protein
MYLFKTPFLLLQALTKALLVYPAALFARQNKTAIRYAAIPATKTPNVIYLLSDHSFDYMDFITNLFGLSKIPMISGQIPLQPVGGKKGGLIERNRKAKVLLP